MSRRVSAFLLTAVVMVLIVSVVSQAEVQPLLTGHTREAVVNGQAQFLGRLPATQSMDLELVLALRHPVELENFLQELYDPSSSSYRQFVTVEQFTERFGPSREDYDAVIQFAKANGFTVVGTSRNRMNLSVKGTVAAIEKAFHLTMGVYQHPTENRPFYAPDREPTVDLPFQLWHITGLENYSIPRPLYKHRNLKVQPEAQTGSCPDQSFCGSDMRAAYYEGTALTGAGQTLGLLEYLGTDLADLNTYYQNAGQTLQVPITLFSVGGASTSCYYSQGCDDTEQTLDMTQALGMAPNLSSLVMYIANYPNDTAILNAMATANPLNAQLSCSWYWNPADPKAINPYFEEFAAQGQNFFDAAGDDGSWQYGGSIWPADNAYLVSVGGTDLTTQSAGGPWASEVAWSPYSGGGISPNGIPIPSWQVATADQCIDACSKTLRNGPDVSANANFTFYVCADQSGCTANEYGGTSFAAPMWAGYLALANQQQVALGFSTLGFINPALYAIGLSGSYTTDFHDITSGNNHTYQATTGYDLVTGWGSPNGANLINALVGPPQPSFSLTANPTSLSIQQGNSGTSTITVNPYNGFNGSVTLSASGLPSGATAGFNPNPTTNTSTLTITVGSGTPTGTSTVTISGVSGSLSSSTNIQLTVTPSGPVVTFNPTSLTWGKVPVGHTGAAKKVTVTNTGGSVLDISNIATSGDFALAPSGKKACGKTLAVGASCIQKVTFTPTQTGLRTGDLTFTDNAAGSPQSVPLSGTGK